MVKYNLWLEYNSKGEIHLQIRYTDKEGSTKIKIPQWSIYQMILLRLRIRPISQKKNKIDTRFELGNLKDISDTIDYNTVKIQYDEALLNLKEILTFAEGDRKKLAEKQFDNLVKKQQIMDLLKSIDCANAARPDPKSKALKIKMVKV